MTPPAPIRELRDLTRARTAITRERGREVQRLEKLLEDAGIKLSSVASDIVGVSGRAMLEALIDGQRDPAVLADLAKRRLRVKIPELTEALTGRFTSHHAFLARVRLGLIDQHTAAVDRLTGRIEETIEPFRGFRDLICSIPGISTGNADVIVAEIARTCPGSPPQGTWPHGLVRLPAATSRPGRSSRPRPGRATPYLQGALDAAAMSCGQHPTSYLGAKYWRSCHPTRTTEGQRRRPAMLVAIWNMGTNGAFYDDLGSDYYTRLNPERARSRAVYVDIPARSVPAKWMTPAYGS